jgi:hypothetical protein
MLFTKKKLYRESLNKLVVQIIGSILKQEQLPDGFGSSCLGFYQGNRRQLPSSKQLNSPIRIIKNRVK